MLSQTVVWSLFKLVPKPKLRCWNQNEPDKVFTQYLSNMGPELFLHFCRSKPRTFTGLDRRYG